MAHGMNGHDFTTKVPSTERLLTTQGHMEGKGKKKKGYSSYVRRTLVKDYNYKHACMKLAERIYIKISRRPAAAA